MLFVEQIQAASDLLRVALPLGIREHLKTISKQTLFNDEPLFEGVGAKLLERRGENQPPPVVNFRLVFADKTSHEQYNE